MSPTDGFEVELTASTYKQLYRQRLHTILNTFSIDTVLDVGANKGGFGLLLRDIGFEGAIFSFEPIQGVYDVLKETIGIDRNWIAYNCALGKSNSCQLLHISPWSEFSSFYETNDFCHANFGINSVKTGSVEVEVKTIQSVIDKEHLNKRRILVKLDTQGHDLEVMKGAENCLNSIAVIQAELPLKNIYKNSPNIEDFFKYFSNVGYSLSSLFPVSQNKRSLVTYEFDSFWVNNQFIPKSSVEDIVPFFQTISN